MKKLNDNDDLVVKELDAVKRLIALLLLKCSASQGEIAMALGVDQSVVSRMFPARKVKKFPLWKQSVIDKCVPIQN